MYVPSPYASVTVFLNFERSPMFSRCSLFLFTMTAASVICLYIDAYYLTLRQSNGTRMVEGSSITNIIFNLVISDKGQELRVQSRYLTATPRVSCDFYIRQDYFE
jgi:hypothetical protein